MVSAISFKKIWRPLILAFSLAIIFVLGPFLFYNINFMGRIYPNIYIAQTDVGGLTPEDAFNKVSTNVKRQKNIFLKAGEDRFNLSSEDIGLNYNFAESVNRAFNLPRTGNFVFDAKKRINLLTNKADLGMSIEINETALTEISRSIAKNITIEPVYPSVKLVNGVPEVQKGSDGTRLDLNELRALIGKALSFNSANEIVIPVAVVDAAISDSQAENLKIRAEKYLGKSITLNFEGKIFEYKDDSLLGFLGTNNNYNDQSITDVNYKIASEINRDPQNSKFTFDGVKVTEFQPAQDGVMLDSENFKNKLTESLNTLALSEEKNISVELPVIRTKPQITTDQVNDLGIKELIGRGNSTYFHSIPGRVFNVNLAASRINGTLVKPGETFSFNQTLGDVSKFTGYQQAYIISGGKTILGDGGGVCQVSTTLFRAVLNAGLPINERSAHAYRVGYYEQNSPPGIDATVYSPSPDFKFTNDTPAHILIVAKNDPKNYSLIFELYGTSDGRIATITKPVISGVSAPPPDLYQDDPTLALGVVKQIDFAAWGAKIVFNYTVTRNGEQIYQKTFVSNYRPWQAIYLRGTKI